MTPKKKMFDSMADIIQEANADGLTPEDVLGAMLVQTAIVMKAMEVENAKATNNGITIEAEFILAKDKKA